MASLTTLTETNLNTSLAERYNAQIHQTTYFLENGKLKNPTYTEPFLEIMSKGQKYREQAGSYDIDREKAEVEGFKKLEQTFASTILGKDAKIVVISPKGKGHSIYGHNFYDVYQQSEDGIITMSRFSTKNTYSQFLNVAKELDPFSDIPQNPTDADFLKAPLITYKSQVEIQNLMSPDETTMSKEEIERLQTLCAGQIAVYINALINNPNNTDAAQNYHRLLKLAEIITGRDPYTIQEEREEILSLLTKNIKDIAPYLPKTPLRVVPTACGISSSTSQAPYSVSEFAQEDQFGTLKIQCENPTCRATYERTPGQLEKSCRICGGTKGIAC